MKHFLMVCVFHVYQRIRILRICYRSARQIVSRLRLRLLIRRRIAEKASIKLVLGANGKHQPGWIPTEIYSLNIVSPQDWMRSLPENSVDAILAEHVWEHLTKEEGFRAARLCHRYLKPGGRVRIAVPDGFFPDSSYIEFVKPGGLGPSARDHKVLYTYRELAEVFERAGFSVDLLEYFDEKGKFHHNPWKSEEGLIVRSTKVDRGRIFGNLRFRSIILDGLK